MIILFIGNCIIADGFRVTDAKVLLQGIVTAPEINRFERYIQGCIVDNATRSRTGNPRDQIFVNTAGRAGLESFNKFLRSFNALFLAD